MAVLKSTKQGKPHPFGLSTFFYVTLEHKKIKKKLLLIFREKISENFCKNFVKIQEKLLERFWDI